MTAIFETGWDAEHGRPALPALGVLQQGDGQGFACIGQVPAVPCRVMVISTAEVIAAMRADPAYTWVEDVEE